MSKWSHFDILVVPLSHRCLFYMFNQPTMAEDQEFICTFLCHPLQNNNLK